MGRRLRFENTWLLTSVACQADADRNLPELKKCREITPVLGVSYEPAIGPVDFSPYLEFLDWVIIGGESGSHARPFNIEWGRAVVRQCQAAGVPVFFKQVGANAFERRGIILNDGENLDDMLPMWSRITGKRPMKDKKGGDSREWPNDIKVFEYPTCYR